MTSRFKASWSTTCAQSVDEAVCLQSLFDFGNSSLSRLDQKSITDLTIELNDLVQRTHQRKTSLQELQGSTFTISNVGSMGGGHFSPIINYPEVAIMGMGAARMKPVVIEKQEGTYDIVPRLILPVVMTIDHRMLDGGDAHRFLKVMTDALSDPDVLMMTMV